MRVRLSRGRPWWLYICSQLGFTSSFRLLLQVEVLGLVGFVYPSSGLLPWQEPGRQISRTEGSYPRQISIYLHLLLKPTMTRTKSTHDTRSVCSGYVGMTLIWSLWLCRNDKVFNNKNCSILKVIYRCTRTLRVWSQL
jgi:hypothetical protein